MLGTPDYIAPEQISDAQQADIRADIYSLGCTLYYLLTGGPPFQGTSLYDILQAHHSMEAMPLNLVRPEVPVELAAMVAKMMAKEPERRFQEPKEVAQALTPFFKRGNCGLQGSRSGRLPSWSTEARAGRCRASSPRRPSRQRMTRGRSSERQKVAGARRASEPELESLIDPRRRNALGTRRQPFGRRGRLAWQGRRWWSSRVLLLGVSSSHGSVGCQGQDLRTG